MSMYPILRTLSFPALLAAIVLLFWHALGKALGAVSMSYGREAKAVRHTWLRRRLGLERRTDPTRRSFLRDRRGVAAVEFAIIAPIFIFLIGLGIDGSLGVIAKASLTFGTQQAAVASANGASNWEDVFRGNVPVPAARVTCDRGTCDGTMTYATLFSGVLGVSSIEMSAHAVAVVVAR